LARVVSDSEVCSEQQGLCNNKDIIFHSKLWKMRVDIRRKRKVEKATEFVERMKKV